MTGETPLYLNNISNININMLLIDIYGTIIDITMWLVGRINEAEDQNQHGSDTGATPNVTD
jgi:hypothetical protein